MSAVKVVLSQLQFGAPRVEPESPICFPGAQNALQSCSWDYSDKHCILVFIFAEIENAGRG